MAKKTSKSQNENLKIKQALSSKSDKPTANSIYLQDPSSHSESEIFGK